MQSNNTVYTFLYYIYSTSSTFGMILKDHRKSLKRDPGGKENSIPGHGPRPSQETILEMADYPEL